MNDRLADLGDDVPAWARGDNNGSPTTATSDIEMGTLKNKAESPVDFGWGAPADDFQTTPTSQEENIEQANTNTIMEDFFRDVEKIKADVEALTDATKRIRQIDEKSKLAVSESDEKRMSEEIKHLINGTNLKAKSTKNMLSLLREENKKFQDNNTVNATNLRKRENLVNTLTRKFIDEMKEYQNAQQTFKVNIKKKAEQQILYVKEDATPEEIEEIMKSDTGREGLLQQSILQGGVNESIKQTYTKVAGKYQDVLILEQSVAELHQMFLDFALLTEQQGELVDQIDFNVKSAADYVEDANVDVYHAIEYSKKVRKKQCMIIVIVIVVTIVLLFAFRILP